MILMMVVAIFFLIYDWSDSEKDTIIVESEEQKANYHTKLARTIAIIAGIVFGVIILIIQVFSI